MTNVGPAANLRKQSRHRVLKGGKIVSVTMHSAIDVTILDMSAGGAQIKMPATTDFPEKFGLLVVAEKLLYPATLRWRRGETIGIEFTGEPRHSSLRK